MPGKAVSEFGWVRIPFDGGARDACFMAIGNPDVASEDDWRPAYKSLVRGARVLQMRLPGELVGVGQRVVWSKVNGYIERVAVVIL
jgi:hypothetical protein